MKNKYSVVRELCLYLWHGYTSSSVAHTFRDHFFSLSADFHEYFWHSGMSNRPFTVQYINRQWAMLVLGWVTFSVHYYFSLMALQHELVDQNLFQPCLKLFKSGLNRNCVPWELPKYRIGTIHN